MLIAGDIGGTKTRLALVSPDAGPRAFVAQREYPSGDYPGLEPIVAKFLAETGGHATSACFDVAGPVIGGRAHLTNLPWSVEEGELAASLGFERVTLLNDLQAIAYGVPHLLPAETVVVNQGAPVEKSPIAVLAPGTGLHPLLLRRRARRFRAGQCQPGRAVGVPARALRPCGVGARLRRVRPAERLRLRAIPRSVGRAAGVRRGPGGGA